MSSFNDNNRNSTTNLIWPAPLPLLENTAPLPYPINALPNRIQAAVLEVQRFVKAPLALVATCALSSVSLASQALIDVKRATRLEGPTSIYTLVIAESGERKTTCDGYFTKPIRDFEAAQDERMKPALAQYAADLAMWNAEREGLLARAKENAKSGNDSEEQATRLAELENNKPARPKTPRLISTDETPESLAWTLATQWPSRGIVSSEAGAVLGAHGMSKDNASRTLPQLNILWDGGSLEIGRRTSESFTVKGARLTISLQIQPEALADFLQKNGTLARGNGFMARFMIAKPETTQGTRNFSEAPDSWPALEKFNDRMRDILHLPLQFNDDGSISATMLHFSVEAKSAWIQFHDEIERELCDGGQFTEVRDVASKSSDNAARLAALFHFFEHGFSEISLDSFLRASAIAKWHLHESLRFFSSSSLPKELADARRLENWLVDYCRQTNTLCVAKNYVRQRGPLRDKMRLDAAIEELDKMNRLKRSKEGKCMALHVNPALLKRSE